MLYRQSKDLMDGQPPLKIGHDMKTSDAARIMSAADAEAAIVTSSGGKFEGILTSRDLKDKIIAAGRDPAHVRVEEVMERNVATINAEENLFDALSTMKAEKRHHMPVVDDNNTVIGMISDTDLSTYTLDEAMNHTKHIAQTTVKKKYQPFVISATILFYAFAAVAIWAMIVVF